MILISCGPDLECHEEFLRRIRRDPLPLLLGVKERPEDWSPVPFLWPGPFRVGDDLSAALAESVANRMNSLDTTTTALKAMLKNGLTVIESELKGPLSDRDAYLLESWLGYWNTWWTKDAPIPPGKAIAVAVWLKCPYGAVDVPKLRAQYPFSRWPNIRGAVLDELQPVTVGEAQDWALHDAVRPHYPRDAYPRLSAEIRRLFPAGECVPMRTLAPGLLTALRRVNGRVNG